MKRITYRSCIAPDMRKFALFTSDPDMVHVFDNSYKVAFKSLVRPEQPELLATWKQGYTVQSQDVFPRIMELKTDSEVVGNAIDSLMKVLVAGVDLFFWDDSVIGASKFIYDNIMRSNPETDFILFSTSDVHIKNQWEKLPYMISWYFKETEEVPFQHRIRCKGDFYSFRMAIDNICARRQCNLGLSNTHGGCEPVSAETELNIFNMRLREGVSL